jgi:hypothetical protein
MAVDDDGGVRAEGVGGLAHGSGTLSVESWGGELRVER